MIISTPEPDMTDRTENKNLDVMRNSDAEAKPDPLGEIHQSLESLLREVRELRAELAALRR